MDSQRTFSQVLTRLGYAKAPGLVSSQTPPEHIPAAISSAWVDLQEKFQLDALYFIADAPVIYFKRFEALDIEALATFHCKVWNQSLVPLIFVILPGEVRVYNGYEAPERGDLGTFREPTRLDSELAATTSQNDLWTRLDVFTRTSIESGSFWRDYGDHFHRDNRADQMLLANLRLIRRELINDGLRADDAHALIGRSIFALYLQDRGVLETGRGGFFAQRYGNNMTRYTELLDSHTATYKFFKLLRAHFHGDMFPVNEDEEQRVTSTHLSTLKSLFTTDALRGNQLLFFWAYDFAYIPIELISSIYEEFLHHEENGLDGAYYTPPILAEFMLDRVMPRDDSRFEIRVLDPACGSGIFLVQAYRRLVQRWRSTHGQRPKPHELVELLRETIFGIDKKLPALQVAAFSLYLALLDHVEPKSIWIQVQFPPLIGSNLREDDFFAVDGADWEGFDVVVGNPPWESQLSSAAIEYLRRRHHSVGDKQIAQAFLLKAPEHCAPDGRLALLCSSKSLLHNKSRRNLLFRQAFFSVFCVEMVFDFSAVRRFLFEKAIGPAAAVFYSPGPPRREATILYGAPKPTPLTRRFAAILLEGNDLKRLPVAEVLSSLQLQVPPTRRRRGRMLAGHSSRLALFLEDSVDPSSRRTNIWKTALWGTSFDYQLVNRLNIYKTLGQIVEELDWHSGVGINKGGPGTKSYFEWLDNAPFIEARHITRYGVDPHRIARLPRGAKYYRGGAQDPGKFKGPMVLFKRSQSSRRPTAAYLREDCTYTEGVIGIAGTSQHSSLLKALTALLNSDLAQYYLFMTSASWGVEREEIKPNELMALPFPFADTPEETIAQIASLVDELANLTIQGHALHEPNSLWSTDAGRPNGIDSLERKLNMLVYDCFGIGAQEAQLIQQTVQYTIGLFNSPEGATALERPDQDMLSRYSSAYTSSLNFYLEPTGGKLCATVFLDDDSARWLTIGFHLAALDDSTPSVQSLPATAQMRRVLKKVGVISGDLLGSTSYVRRSFRLFDGRRNVFYIVKPAERRFWTIAAAFSDAEEAVLDVARDVTRDRAAVSY